MNFWSKLRLSGSAPEMRNAFPELTDSGVINSLTSIVTTWIRMGEQSGQKYVRAQKNDITKTLMNPFLATSARLKIDTVVPHPNILNNSYLSRIFDQVRT
jgi:hypothetical protein